MSEQRAKKTVGPAMLLAGLLREAVTDSGVSVYRTAKETGTDPSILNQFVNGSRGELYIDSVDRLMRFLGLRVVAQARQERDSSRRNKAASLRPDSPIQANTFIRSRSGVS